jgi:glycosyltransferase involved in cell wall biosynthesis
MSDPSPAETGPRPQPTEALRVALTLEQCWHRVPGGTAAAALGCVRALQHHQPQLELIGVAARHRSAPPEPWVPPIPVRQLPLPRPALYESWHRLRRPAVERATGAVDVIHVTGMAMPPPSAPLVVTVNDLIFRREPELFTRRGVAFFRRAIELTWRDAAIVVCPSRDAVDDCVAEGFPVERIRLVPYGIDAVPTTEDEVADVRRRFGIDGPYVLWLGTIEPRKNVATLLRAFDAVDTDARLVLAGASGWNDDIGPLVDRLGDRVRAVGFVSDDDKRALYAGAEVFCQPSRREGFGLPVLEAMAQGTPVVVTERTSLAEIVGDDVDAGVVVDTSSAAPLTDALQKLLDDDDRRTQLGIGARRRSADFSWRRTAQLLADAYADARAGVRS